MVKRAEMATKKEINVRKMVRIKEKAKNSGANVRFAEIGDGGPRNSAIATTRGNSVSEENDANCADREV